MMMLVIQLFVMIVMAMDMSYLNVEHVMAMVTTLQRAVNVMVMV